MVLGSSSSVRSFCTRSWAGDVFGPFFFLADSSSFFIDQICVQAASAVLILRSKSAQHTLIIVGSMQVAIGREDGGWGIANVKSAGA